MKYLFIIFAIASASIPLSRLLLISPKKTVPDNIAFTINVHDIAKNAVIRGTTRFDYHADDQSEIFDSSSSPSKTSLPNIDRQEITGMLKNYKRQQKINGWLTELKQNANITIHKQEQVQ